MTFSLKSETFIFTKKHGFGRRAEGVSSDAVSCGYPDRKRLELSNLFKVLVV